jgi:hypothetical protein
MFIGNYTWPQAGNPGGGTIEFDECADRVEILSNTFQGQTIFEDTQAMELYSRNLSVSNNTITGYPREGIDLNSTLNARVMGNTITNNGLVNSSLGGINIATAPTYLTGPCGDTRESIGSLVTNNVSTGQSYGVHLVDTWGESSNRIHSPTIESNILSPNNLGLIGLDSTVRVDSPSSGTPAFTLRQRGADQPRVSTVRASTPRCGTGSRIDTYQFPFADTSGISNIKWVSGIFSIKGPDGIAGEPLNCQPGVNCTPGPDSGAQGCRFIYDRQANTIYLDGPTGGETWVGSRLLEPGALPLSNGYCTIHVGQSAKTEETYYLTLHVKVEFVQGTESFNKDKHIYSISGNYEPDLPPPNPYRDNRSRGGQWAYWGWWLPTLP